jgi:hypothetical protein
MPLNDSELAAVNDGVAAMEKLLEQLADVPTPVGPTPRELGNRVYDGEVRGQHNESVESDDEKPGYIDSLSSRMADHRNSLIAILAATEHFFSVDGNPRTRRLETND